MAREEFNVVVAIKYVVKRIYCMVSIFYKPQYRQFSYICASKFER